MSQYGRHDPVLPPADYKLVQHLENETVYTFCMCPGGYVVAAASEEGRCVTNGMSNADRDGVNANAALLVTLNPRDFPGGGWSGRSKSKKQRSASAAATTMRLPSFWEISWWESPAPVPAGCSLPIGPV